MNRNDLHRLEKLEKAVGKMTAQQNEAWSYFVDLMNNAARAKAIGDNSVDQIIETIASLGAPK